MLGFLKGGNTRVRRSRVAVSQHFKLGGANHTKSLLSTKVINQRRRRDSGPQAHQELAKKK